MRNECSPTERLSACVFARIRQMGRARSSIAHKTYRCCCWRPATVCVCVCVWLDESERNEITQKHTLSRGSYSSRPVARFPYLCNFRNSMCANWMCSQVYKCRAAADNYSRCMCVCVCVRLRSLLENESKRTPSRRWTSYCCGFRYTGTMMWSREKRRAE